MSSSNRSPRSSNTSSSSSSHSSSSHSSHSPRSSHSSRKTSNEGRSERREEGVTTSIQGNLNQGVTTTQKAEVFVQTKESWDMEAIQELEKKIAVEQAALIDAQKLVNDQTTLFNEAQQTKEDKLRSAQKLETFVSQKTTDRDRLLQEEKQLELQRAAAHAKAVEAESARTELLAQAVLAKEEAKVSESLSLQRKEGINQAQALVDAHRLAIQKLEEHRVELKRKDVNVSVRGEALPQPKAVDINVAVKPLDLPEARVTSNAVSTGAGAQSHIHEALPTHEKTVLPAREVNVSEAHAQKSTVERHVVQNVSNVTNITTQPKRDQNIS